MIKRNYSKRELTELIEKKISSLESDPNIYFTKVNLPQKDGKFVLKYYHDDPEEDLRRWNGEMEAVYAAYDFAVWKKEREENNEND